MNVFTIALAYIRARPLHTCLNVMLLALGIAAITLLMLFTEQLEGQMTRDAEGIDMVVGAKGSPIQLILSGIYHVDVPTGNIRLADAEALAANPMVKETFPLALGDSFRGFRIVGTSHDYPRHYKAVIAAGALWENPQEVALGALVARDLGLIVGDRFILSHGFADGGSAHAKSPYLITGIFARSGTVVDRLILTSIESVWIAHGVSPGTDLAMENHGNHAEILHDNEEGAGKANKMYSNDTQEITALLVRFSSPIAVVTLPRVINAETSMQAALPGYEISRMFKLVGAGIDGFRAFSMVLVISAGIGIFVALYNALSERRYDIAVFRALGASRRRVLWQFLVEGLLLSFAGALIGLMLGHLIAELTGQWLWREHQLHLSGLTWLSGEFYLVVLSLGTGMMAALLPAIQAYRVDVSEVLSEG